MQTVSRSSARVMPSRGTSAIAPIQPSTSARTPQLSQGIDLAPGHRNRQVACQGLFGLGLPELAVIVGVSAMVFGPSKLLPSLGKSMGATMKGFQGAVEEFKDEMGDSLGKKEGGKEGEKKEGEKKEGEKKVEEANKSV